VKRYIVGEGIPLPGDQAIILPDWIERAPGLEAMPMPIGGKVRLVVEVFP
jgi:hypothetical protein